MRLSVVLDSVDPRAVAGFWCRALDYRPAGDLGTFLVLVPEQADGGAAGGATADGGPMVILQEVAEPREGKNRRRAEPPQG